MHGPPAGRARRKRGRDDRRLVRRDPRDRQRDGGDGGVQGGRDIRGDGDIANAQQVEAGEQTADHRAGGISAVEKPQPRNAFRRRLDPASHCRQRRAHQHCRRQQADAGRHAAQQDADDTLAGPRGVCTADQRHAE